ncbi:zinc-binding dehydrogenase [Saccharothrix syringae]|uniref:Oxidoreductase n=1 Tax=Saccharothrix syringae TaxID=103733 RepID=A0A5Q0GSK4_SACSY|nr:zinc-binding dehydrogenase [Saccharothrix syringae]QFZ17037.1 oxidoreductase [Saccharothrix syringae]
MRAVRLREPGVLRVEEVEDPEPGPGRARIAVRAAGVHPADLSCPDLPTTPGREVAGVVDAIGPDVDGAWLGRRVVTQLGLADGGYAELAVREVGALHVVPEGVGFAAAVAMIRTGGTALGVLDAAGLDPDDVVLVTAAAGGVGGLLVRGAVLAGAFVVGLVGAADKRRAVLRAGAAAAVDYRRQGWRSEVAGALAGREVTAVLDGVGGAEGRGAFDLLGQGGRLVVFGSSSGELLPMSTSDLFARSLTAVVAAGPHMARRAGGVRALEARALAEAGRLAPVVQEFPLAEAARAHAALAGRRTVGKVVLLPGAR